MRETAGGSRVWCNGRRHARRFYERHGLKAVGEEFVSPHTGRTICLCSSLTTAEAEVQPAIAAAQARMRLFAEALSLLRRTYEEIAEGNNDSLAVSA
jgi:hypothetical protein